MVMWNGVWRLEMSTWRGKFGARTLKLGYIQMAFCQRKPQKDSWVRLLDSKLACMRWVLLRILLKDSCVDGFVVCVKLSKRNKLAGLSMLVKTGSNPRNSCQ